MSDRRYLLQQRQAWYAVVEVPPSLRAKLGRRIKRTLRTSDLNVARARRWSALTEIKAQIETARRAPPGAPLVDEAVALREALVDAVRVVGGDRRNLWEPSVNTTET